MKARAFFSFPDSSCSSPRVQRGALVMVSFNRPESSSMLTYGIFVTSCLDLLVRGGGLRKKRKQEGDRRAKSRNDWKRAKPSSHKVILSFSSSVGFQVFPANTILE